MKELNRITKKSWFKCIYYSSLGHLFPSNPFSYTSLLLSIHSSKLRELFILCHVCVVLCLFCVFFVFFAGWERTIHLISASATERKRVCVCHRVWCACFHGTGTKHRKPAASESNKTPNPPHQLHFHFIISYYFVTSMYHAILFYSVLFCSY